MGRQNGKYKHMGDTVLVGWFSARFVVVVVVVVLFLPLPMFRVLLLI